MADDDLVLRIRLSLKGRPIKSYAFQQDVITIGRDPEADIFLDNPGISREHVRIERLPNGQYSLKDMGSANGTYVNDEPVKSAVVYSADVVRIGKFSLWLAMEHDRRQAQRTDETHRAYSEFAPETIMLSTTELDRLMKASRDPADPAVARAPAPLDSSEPAPAGRIAARPPAPAYASAPAMARPRRTLVLAWVGLVVVLSASLGAGFAWLFLR
jgi:predicted component of type VI protein secretion system